VNKTLAAILLTLALPTAFATGGGDWKAHSERRLERMTQELQLTDAQKTSVRTLMEAQWAQRKEMREQMRTQFAGVLTPEQMTKLDQLHAERKARWKDKGKRHHEHCAEKPAS